MKAETKGEFFVRKIAKIVVSCEAPDAPVRAKELAANLRMLAESRDGTSLAILARVLMLCETDVPQSSSQAAWSAASIALQVAGIPYEPADPLLDEEKLREIFDAASIII